MKKRDEGSHVLLPGDSGCCELISKTFDNREFVNLKR